jgi:hypothetical protein
VKRIKVIKKGSSRGAQRGRKDSLKVERENEEGRARGREENG